MRYIASIIVVVLGCGREGDLATDKADAEPLGVVESGDGDALPLALAGLRRGRDAGPLKLPDASVGAEPDGGLDADQVELDASSAPDSSPGFDPAVGLCEPCASDSDCGPDSTCVAPFGDAPRCLPACGDSDDSLCEAFGGYECFAVGACAPRPTWCIGDVCLRDNWEAFCDGWVAE